VVIFRLFSFVIFVGNNNLMKQSVQKECNLEMKIKKIVAQVNAPYPAQKFRSMTQVST